MRFGSYALLVPLGLAACGTTQPATGVNAYGTRSSLTCVRYARAISGLDLRGDAWFWWAEAAGRYARGQAPGIGAVLVFRRHGSMDDGHVAVVTNILAPREITVTQANWLPGRIEHGQPVFDISPLNDWTLVRVWYPPSRALGITAYPTDGFIQPVQPRSREAIERLETALASG